MSSLPLPRKVAATAWLVVVVTLLAWPSLVRAPAASAAPVMTRASVSAVGGAAVSAEVVSAAVPTVEELIGQKMVVRMDGTTPSGALLGRIRRGEVGGVILFGFNITGKAQLASVTARLQGAAASAGRPRLLVMVDQEGGNIRTVSWAPPSKSARQMGADGRTSTARTLGEATGAALHGLGINVDLAPVADVPSSTSSFMYLAARTFGFSETKVSRLANAFAAGLRAKGTIATMKHFPGIGRSTRNTDRFVVTIKASRTSLEKDIYSYRAAIAGGVRLIMLSNATYTAYDPVNAAGWSPAVATTLLRTRLGFTGVSITDSLSGTAVARGVPARVLAAKAARAGTDMVMLTGHESATDAAFDSLVAKAKDGRLPLSLLRVSYARIIAFKAGL